MFKWWLTFHGNLIGESLIEELCDDWSSLALRDYEVILCKCRGLKAINVLRDECRTEGSDDHIFESEIWHSIVVAGCTLGQTMIYGAWLVPQNLLRTLILCVLEKVGDLFSHIHVSVGVCLARLPLFPFHVTMRIRVSNLAVGFNHNAIAVLPVLDQLVLVQLAAILFGRPGIGSLVSGGVELDWLDEEVGGDHWLREVNRGQGQAS